MEHASTSQKSTSTSSKLQEPSQSKLRRLDTAESSTSSFNIKTEIGSSTSNVKSKCQVRSIGEEETCKEIQITSTYQVYSCQSRGCYEKADSYCSACPKFYCREHNQFHSDMLEEHRGNVMSVEAYRQQSSQIDSYPMTCCPAHGEEYVTVCKLCLELLCDGCLDNTDHRDSCCAHLTRPVSIRKGANLAYENLVEETFKLQIIDQKLESLLKFANQQIEAVTEENRRKINQLHHASKEWKDKLDEITVKLEKILSQSTHQFTMEVRQFEKEINDQLKSNQMLENTTCHISEQQPLTLLQCHKIHELSLKHQQLENIPALPTPTLYQLENLSVDVPWKAKPRYPLHSKKLTLKSQIKTPKNCYTVSHLSDGTLLHGGQYGIVGLEKDITNNIWGMFVEESPKSELTIFTLGLTGDEREIRKINSRETSKTVITYDANESHLLHHIAANELYVITCDTPTKGLKVFSKSTYEHKFDIKHELIAKQPFGIELLVDNTLVVSDSMEGNVINITIDDKPTVIWHLVLHKPSGIHVDKTSGCILVACNDGDKIYVITMDGRLLTTLVIPNGEKFVNDLSFYDNQLAIANRTHGVKIFTIK